MWMASQVFSAEAPQYDPMARGRDHRDHTEASVMVGATGRVQYEELYACLALVAERMPSFAYAVQEDDYGALSSSQHDLSLLG